MDKYNEIKLFVASLEEEVTKIFNKGNKAAAVRVRAELQTLKILAQELREDIQKQVKQYAGKSTK